MADVVEEMTRLTREIVGAEYGSAEDVRLGFERLRRLCVVTAEILDMAEYQLNYDLTHAANGKRSRARQVTRPIRHASAMMLVANRRIKSAWNVFLKVFAEELATTRGGDRRDPFKFGR